MVSTAEVLKRDVAPPKYHEPVQGTVFHGDGREQALLTHLQSLPSLSDTELAPLSLADRSQRVLETLHEFGKKHYLMSVGDTKGRQVEALIKERKPRLILELGTYVGYSGVAFSRHLLDLHPDAAYPAEWASAPHERWAGYVSLEKSEVYAETAREAFRRAGVDGAVRVITGSSTPSLRNLRKTLNMPRPLQFDMVFLDHLKPLYTVDLKTMEEEGLVGPGTTLVADNVVKPGNPPYLSYVRASPSQKRHAASLPPLGSDQAPPPTPNPTTDAEWLAAFRDGPIDETRWTPPEAEGCTARGDPGLRYESKMLAGWDPYTGEQDACEVSTCVGRED